jgi:hypothetical protein
VTVFTVLAAQTPRKTASAAILAGGSVWQHPLWVRDGVPYAVAVLGLTWVLRVKNLTGARIEAVVSVDGRNVQKDEPGDPYGNAGLLIPGHDHRDIEGWRTDDGHVREFVFTDPAQAVAAQAGAPQNTGVIGLAAWREGAYGWKANVPLAAAAGQRDSLPRGMTVNSRAGTGIGAARPSPVTQVRFNREGDPDLLAIFYDTEAALREKGIIAGPQPWPGIGGYETYQEAR